MDENTTSTPTMAPEQVEDSPTADDAPSQNFLLAVRDLCLALPPLSPFASVASSEQQARVLTARYVLAYLQGGPDWIHKFADGDPAVTTVSDDSGPQQPSPPPEGLVREEQRVYQNDVLLALLADHLEESSRKPDVEVAGAAALVPAAPGPAVEAPDPEESVVSPKKKPKLPPLSRTWAFFIPAHGRGQRWQEIYRLVGPKLGLPEILTIPQNPNAKREKRGVVCCLMQSADLCEQYDALILGRKAPKAWFTRFFGMSECCEKVAMGRYLKRLAPVFEEVSDSVAGGQGVGVAVCRRRCVRGVGTLFPDRCLLPGGKHIRTVVFPDTHFPIVFHFRIISGKIRNCYR